MAAVRTSRVALGSSVLLSALVSVATTGCYGESQEAITSESDSISPDTSTFPATFARQWMTNLTLSVKFDGVSPPVAARTYTYGAIALYEAVVHGMPGFNSFAGQLNGLDSLPTPAPGEYDWPTVLAQTMHRVVNAGLPDLAHGSTDPKSSGVFTYRKRIFYEYTTPVQASLVTLGPTQIAFRRADGVPDDVINRSIDYANALGDAITAWSDADGYYDVRYKGFVPPTGPGLWVPTGFSDTDKVANPVEPYFGTLRPLVLHTPDECAPPPPAPYSTDPSSAFYAQANAVYQTSLTETFDQLDTARYWADGPGDTATPAGHWVNIATQLLRPTNLAQAAAGYAFTSLGYYDAFVSIWQSKYQYNLVRPETYIRANIRSNWRPFLPTPPFPSYVSGHSGQSAAAAVLFTQQFGEAPFTDRTKIRRGFAARTYSDFTAASQEAALSRLLAGIHYPDDNNNGLALGQCVGNAILARVHID